MQPNTNIVTLDTKVAAMKIIARDALRMKLISPRLSTISNLENEIKEINKAKDIINHEILVTSYEISKLDTGHPNYDKTKTAKEEKLKVYTEALGDNDKEITEIQKEIDEQKAGIAKINNGETLVSKDELNALVETLIIQDAKNQIVNN